MKQTFCNPVSAVDKGGGSPINGDIAKLIGAGNSNAKRRIGHGAKHNGHGFW